MTVVCSLCHGNHMRSECPVADRWKAPEAPPTETRRTKADRIERLRTRVQKAKTYGLDKDVAGVLLGILDLLGDEL